MENVSKLYHIQFQINIKITNILIFMLIWNCIDAEGYWG